jgi:hypothetical protein
MQAFFYALVAAALASAVLSSTTADETRARKELLNAWNISDDLPCLNLTTPLAELEMSNEELEREIETNFPDGVSSKGAFMSVNVRYGIFAIGTLLTNLKHKHHAKMGGHHYTAAMVLFVIEKAAMIGIGIYTKE